MEILGYIASILIGVSLGIIGGGGSILTVPVLVYLFYVDPVLATGYSLFIVGVTSAAGSVSYFKKGLVNIRTAIIFGIPSIIAVFFTRAFIIPSIPDELIEIGTLTITKGIFLLIVFALLMIVASYSMIAKGNLKPPRTSPHPYRDVLIVTEGTAVGILTGLVGAGGGFLIIPALVVLSKLPMKEAVGTSLVIIAAKSLIGFFGEGGNVDIEWAFLFLVSAFAISGIFIGAALSKKIDGDRLKPIFGWFILMMGIYIILRETVFT
jgi:uncharacterized protein